MSRRRAVVVGASTAVGAALIACNGDDNKGSSGSSSSSSSSSSASAQPTAKPAPQLGSYTPSSGAAQTGGKLVQQATGQTNLNVVIDQSDGQWSYDRPL